MGKLKKLAVCTTLLVVVCSYMLYTPIPEGYDKPWQIHLSYSLTKLTKALVSVGESLGFGQRLQIMNKLYEFEASVFATLYPTKGVSWKESTMAGVRVVVYSPDGITSRNSARGVLYIHGGGWIVGSPELYHGFTAKISEGLNAVVVSVDYRLAPEHIFPAAFEDCLKVARYFMSHTKEYGVDPSRIAIAGDSAGGQLAASVVLALRDENFKPPPKLQVLIYPITQAFNLETPSYQANRDGPVLTAMNMASFFALYVQGHGENIGKILNNTHVSSKAKRELYPLCTNKEALPKDVVHSDYQSPDLTKEDENLANEMAHGVLSYKLSPLLSKDFKNLPTTYIYAAHLDVLRDDALSYAHRLSEAGVQVFFDHDKIGYHGKFFVGFQAIDDAIHHFQILLDFMRDNL